MKRRYKKGDWFRVPLGARSDALGIITQACRSRLFGYFFAAPEGEIANAALKRLRPQDACARFLFGGDPIDLLRWPLLATSLDFDESRWPFPAFAHRGAFGRAWIIREFDPETLQVVAQRTIERDAAQDLPGAHFVRVTEAEDLLARAVDGTATPAPSVICECRVPIEASSLEPLAGGGRVQVSQALSRTDAAALARSLTHPSTELCVHDVYGVPFDCRVLREWPALRALALDTGNLSHVEAIGALEQLELLQIHAGALNGLISNSARELRVAGDGSIVDVRTWPALESLVLENAASQARTFRGP